MRTLIKTGLIGAVLLHLTASAALAQATIAGVVRDSSGAVLPGVVVEATSPALTEKVRTALSDGTGQYPYRHAPARELRRDVLADRVHHGQA